MLSPAKDLRKLNYDKLGTILSLCDFTPTAEMFLSDPLDPVIFFNQLLEQKLWMDSITFLAMSLPKREAIWWGYLGVIHKLDEKKVTSLENVKRWVYAPDQDLARQLQDSIVDGNMKTGVEWLKIAPFWAGDNIAPKDAEAIEPQPLLGNQAVVNAFRFIMHDYGGTDELAERFLLQGMHIANGGNGMIIKEPEVEVEQ